MGGSGSGGVFNLDPDEAAKRRQEAEQAARIGQIDAEVNAILSKRLIEVNQRDSEAVNSHLEEIEAAISDQIEGVDRLLFGGSVAKHTYVEGVSDIDSLLILDTDNYADLSPGEVMEKLQQALESSLNRSEAIEIRSGDLAVTVRYDDGLEVQLLPAVQRQKGLSITSPTGNDWLAINPEAFAERLSKVNKDQAGAVVPAIKLAKSILANEAATLRPNGYHLEALAVAAFEDYSGPRNPKAMVTYLFDSASKNVKRPIPDVTGQSPQVDANLGGENSANRRRMSERLRVIARRMKNSSSVETWQTLLGDA